jgi:hypothetical protein
VAVKVTDWPVVEGFAEELKAAVVAVWLTVWLSALLLLPL